MAHLIVFLRVFAWIVTKITRKSADHLIMMNVKTTMENARKRKMENVENAPNICAKTKINSISQTKDSVSISETKNGAKIPSTSA